MFHSVLDSTTELSPSELFPVITAAVHQVQSPTVLHNNSWDEPPPFSYLDNHYKSLYMHYVGSTVWFVTHMAATQFGHDHLLLQLGRIDSLK